MNYKIKIFIYAGLFCALLFIGSTKAAWAGYCGSWSGVASKNGVSPYTVSSNSGGTASLTNANVQACVDIVLPGDTIIIPNGTAAWTGKVTVNKAIKIKGGDCTLDSDRRPTSCPTVINVNGLSSIFQLGPGDGGIVTITDLALTGAAYFGGSYYTSYLIDVRRNWGYVVLGRIHSRLTREAAAVRIGNAQDWNDINGTALKQKALLFAWNYVGTHNGAKIIFVNGRQATWLEDDDWGTDNAVFIENSYIAHERDDYSNDFCSDTEWGARFVIRYNDIVNCHMGQHDSHTYLRGHRLTENYNNTYTCPSGDCSGNHAWGVRGGTALIYNNTATGNFYAPYHNQISRVVNDGGNLGAVCGSAGNVCKDPTHGLMWHCSGEPHNRCYGSGDTSCNPGTCVVSCNTDSDCGTGRRCVQIDGEQNASGYPCRDQDGWGKDDPATGLNTLAPIYVWNNTFNGSVANIGVNLASSITGYSSSYYLQENRDYCNHSPATACGQKAAWTYRAFTYPHPLQGGSITAYCGDGSCNNAETCSTCPSDCGSCTGGNAPIITIVSPQANSNVSCSSDPFRINLQVATNVAATCRNCVAGSTCNSSTVYANMANFGSTGNATVHTSSPQVSCGESNITYYIRCSDTAGNTNQTSTILNFNTVYSSNAAPAAPTGVRVI